MTQSEIQHEAITRAISSQSVMNYAPIFEGFAAMGIPMDEIRPRENVFTFNAWKALGRHVRKGCHGVKVCTFVPVKGSKESKEDPQENGKRKAGYSLPRTTTVFHISQTEPDVELKATA